MTRWLLTAATPAFLGLALMTLSYLNHATYVVG